MSDEHSSMKTGASTSSAATGAGPDQWIGTAASWASGISLAIYFVTSDGIHNYVRFVITALSKVLRAFG